MRGIRVAVSLVLLAAMLGGCGTPAATTAINPGPAATPIAKYKDAVSVRAVTGGEAWNILMMPGVTSEPFKGALQNGLAGMGYLALSGAPKFFVDAEIQKLDQPLIGLNLEVSATVIYKVSGAGATVTYPITARGTASISDSVVATDRLRYANERAMQENIKAFLQALK